MDLFTAKKITALRKHYALSQEALAEKTGVSRQAVSKWERAEASPDTENIRLLSKIFEVTIDDLLGEKSAEEIIKAKTEKAQTENVSKTEETAATVENKGFATEGSNKATEEKAEKTEVKKALFSETKKDTKPIEKEKDLRKIGTSMLKFPYAIIAVIAYLIIGFSAKLWHPYWIIFLTIPAYYVTAAALKSKTKKGMLLKLPIYLYIIILYILMGFTANLWHPMWILFLLIPTYYWYVAVNVKKAS